MKIEVTYKFELNGSEITLTEDQARELYNELAKSFLVKQTTNPLFPPGTIPRVGDYPYQQTVWCYGNTTNCE